MSITKELLNRITGSAERRLREAGIRSAAVEVEIILEFLLETDRINILLYGPDLIDEKTLDRFAEIVERRATRYPLQYILGEMYFYGRRFMVDDNVMVPTPETEVLCELAINYCKNENLEHPVVLDIGTGSGVISVTMTAELAEAYVTALDISLGAIGVARKNAAIYEVESRIDFRKSDLFSAIRDDEKFDLILSNPPYISEPEYETLPPEVLADPKISLTSGTEGMDIIKQIIDQAPQYLKKNGRLMFEIGYDQAEKVANYSEKNKCYRSFAVIKDLNDIDRVVILTV